MEPSFGLGNQTENPADANHVSSNIPPYKVENGRCVWHWRDENTEAEGWIVIDAPVPTLAGGGLFLQGQATLREVCDVAGAMSAKLAVSCAPQVVGAKGGIRFPHCDPRAGGVLERFIRDNAAIISQYWGTGGDLNTNHATIDEHCRVYCPTSSSTALSIFPRSLNSLGSANVDVAGLLQERVEEIGCPVRDFSAGYVMATTLKKLLLRTNPTILGRARLALQGFGCMGAGFAEAVQKMGIGRVVAISSQYGFIEDSAGIDCTAVEALRRHKRESGTSTEFELNCLEAGLTERQLDSDLYIRRKDGSTEEDHLVDFLSAARAEIFVPCAGRYIITSNVINTLIRKTFTGVPPKSRFILSGSNSAFNLAEPKASYLSQLDDYSIKMLPEWVSNSGTSNLFMRACSGLALKGHASANLRACADDTNAFIDTIFSRVGDDLSSTSLWKVAEEVATARREAGVSNLLGIEKLTHLTLITPDGQRCSQVFQKICGAIHVQDSKKLRLPGSGDPTLAIAQVPLHEREPRNMGLIMHFSVYSLMKARQCLAFEGVGFEEEVLADGSTELALTGEEAGYHIKLCQTPTGRWFSLDSEDTTTATISIAGAVKQLDHYAAVMPNAVAAKIFHERFLGFKLIREITLNVGSAPEGEVDSLMFVMGLPHDSKRSVVLTEGLLPQCLFSKMLSKRTHPFVHHVAFEIEDVEAAFSAVRSAGWATTQESTSLDLASGLRQFFLKDDGVGCSLEMIQRTENSPAPPDAQVTNTTPLVPMHPNDAHPRVGASLPERQSKGASGQGEYRESNIIFLAKGLDAGLE